MPSLRSYAFRLFTKYYLGPKFSVNKTVEEHRNTLEILSKLSLLPLGTNTGQVSLDGVKAEWVSVGKVKEDRVILYLHGGAYTFGPLNTHRNIAARLSKHSGFRALVLDYRLAPESPYPSAIKDSTNAFLWLIKIGISSKNIALAGDSVGGGFTIVTIISLRDNGDPLFFGGMMPEGEKALMDAAEFICNKCHGVKNRKNHGIS